MGRLASLDGVGFAQLSVRRSLWTQMLSSWVMRSTHAHATDVSSCLAPDEYPN